MRFSLALSFATVRIYVIERTDNPQHSYKLELTLSVVRFCFCMCYIVSKLLFTLVNISNTSCTGHNIQWTYICWRTSTLLATWYFALGHIMCKWLTILIQRETFAINHRSNVFLFGWLSTNAWYKWQPTLMRRMFCKVAIYMPYSGYGRRNIQRPASIQNP